MRIERGEKYELQGAGDIVVRDFRERIDAVSDEGVEKSVFVVYTYDEGGIGGEGHWSSSNEKERPVEEFLEAIQ